MEQNMKIALTTVAALLFLSAPAHAGQVEQADRTVERLEVRYAEPVPTKRHPYRAYFELNDGSSFRYLNSRVCMAGDKVPDRICKTVFWYAR
jgi:hypothetical protein